MDIIAANELKKSSFDFFDGNSGIGRVEKKK